jgi:hypothetical protein
MAAAIVAAGCLADVAKKARLGAQIRADLAREINSRAGYGHLALRAERLSEMSWR